MEIPQEPAQNQKTAPMADLTPLKPLLETDLTWFQKTPQQVLNEKPSQDNPPPGFHSAPEQVVAFREAREKDAAFISACDAAIQAIQAAKAHALKQQILLDRQLFALSQRPQCAHLFPEKSTPEAAPDTVAQPAAPAAGDAFSRGIPKLLEWTHKRTAVPLYDSLVHPFTDAALFDAIALKSNVAVIGQTTDGDVFGVFHGKPVVAFDELIYNPACFVFTFESHGRCMTPQRFPVKEAALWSSYVSYFNACDAGFLECGADGSFGGWLTLGGPQSKTSTGDLSKVFEGIENSTLTGGTPDKDGKFHFTICRLFAFELQ